MTPLQAVELALLAGTFAVAHTLCITLPFYRRVCDVCQETGWAKCDRAKHAAAKAVEHDTCEGSD